MDAQPRHSEPAARHDTSEQAAQTATVPYPSPTPRSVEPPTVDLPDRPADTVRGLPRNFGRYELLEEVAHGGMGVVYKAHDKKLGRDVALKMIRSGAFAVAEEVERFQREARAAAQLHHRHIIPIHDIGEHDGRHYFTMEFAAGGSLAKQQERFTADPRAAAALVEKVARAVAHAHASGVLHRDLKPANVLLDEQGEPFVSDFGLAKLLHADVELTQPGQQIGTPAYMAPEQFTDSASAVTARSDVWSLGAMLYVLLTGRLPFAGRDRTTLAEQVRGVDPPSLRKLRRGFDRSLETIVLKCLEKDPAQRYDSAAGLADDLARWLRDEPIMARPPGLSARARRWMRRHATMLVAALAFGGVAVAADIGYQMWDPNRPIKVAKRRIERGEPVELLGVNAPPPWFRWIGGSAGLQDGEAAKGTFCIHSLTLNMLELLPEPYCKRFRFRAEVRHEQAAGGASEVGIYFGRRETALTDGTAQAFWRVSFDDLHDVAQQVPAMAPKSNRATVCYAQVRRAKGPPRSTNDIVAGDLAASFVPAARNNDEKPWRALAVIVDPESVELFWDGVSQGKCPRAQLMGKAKFMVDDLPYPQHVPAEFADGGGLGLFVNRAAASFRNVWLEPLPEPE